MALAAAASNNGPAALVAQGRDCAAALVALLTDQQHGTLRELAGQILRCLDRAVAALHDGKKRRSPPGPAAARARPYKRRARATGAGAPTKVERRSTPEDGFLWRKYGRKDILNSKYPRTYFRCTYKNDNGCKATRQVQQSEDDPSVYVVTYFGEHTCGVDAAAVVSHQLVEMLPQPLVISFGSSGSGSPWLPSASDDDDDDFRSDSSQFSQQAVCLPEQQGGNDVFNVEAEPTSSAGNVSCCASPDLEPLLRYLDWDLISFDETALFQ